MKTEPAPNASFRRDPGTLLQRVTHPATHIVSHLRSTRGQFDRLSWTSDPTQITATDLVAVSMLGRPVPAPTAAWLLSDEGQWLTAEILAEVPVNAILQDCDPKSILKIADLFHLIRRPTSQIPSRPDALSSNLKRAKQGRKALQKRDQRHRDIGQANTTRLLAAKRPGLVPIDDRILRKTLGYSKDETWWLRWKSALDQDTRELVRSIRSEASRTDSAAINLSDLRIFDILFRSRP